MKKKLKSFHRGGFVLEDRYQPSLGPSIENGTLPSLAVVPLLQHRGKPASCRVEPGDLVREEQLLGLSTGADAVPVHAPIPGRVREIREIYLADGRKCPAVVISLEGGFARTGRKRNPRDWSDLGAEELLGIIRETGLVELGGPACSLYQKYQQDRQGGIRTFILNGTDGEPYLMANKFLMENHASELLEALEMIRRILRPERMIVGIAEGQRESLDRWERLLDRSQIREEGVQLEAAALESRYPQGDERNLLESLTGDRVTDGGLVREIGGSVSHAATLKALHEAVVWEKPLVDRFVTLAGRGLRQPVIRRIRLGMPLVQLVEEAGGLSGEPLAKLVSGGPMSGHSVYDPATPVTKSTAALLALTKKEVRDSRETQCLRCGRCLAVCPAGLDPSRLLKLIEHRKLEEAAAEGLEDCRECGSCGYVCPARIPLVQGMQLGKSLRTGAEVRL